MATNFLKQITLLEHVDPTKEIVIYVDTYGGNCDAAIAMHDAMKICHCPITTVGIGKVMSAGVLILTTGDKGSRFITKNSRVMMHQISGGSYGTTRDMAVYTEEMKRQQDVFYQLIADYSGQNKQKLLNHLSSDVYLSAEDAFKIGLVDGILEYSKIIPNKTSAKPKTKTKSKDNLKITKNKKKR